MIEYTIDSGQGKHSYRLITSLLDTAVFPALLLATEYHQRSRSGKYDRRTQNPSQWTQDRRRSVSGSAPIRSLKPREVVQEIYGWLLGHYAVRHLMFTAAQQAGISPLRLGFTGTLKVLRRAIADFQDVQSEELPFFSPN